jgi:hypothetical protein
MLGHFPKPENKVWYIMQFVIYSSNFNRTSKMDKSMHK